MAGAAGSASDSLKQQAHEERKQKLETIKQEALMKRQETLAKLKAKNGVENKSQFGGQVIFKDEQDNLFFGTQKRKPLDVEGQESVTSVLSPIGNGPDKPVGKVSMVGQFGLTADETVSHKSKVKSSELRGQAGEQIRTDYIKQGLAAGQLMSRTRKLIDLNDAIHSGKITKARKMMSDIFGITDPDIGKFHAMAGKMVLDNIRMLGANPTEGERAFLQSITPSLEQGGEVNDALLKDMLEVQERQVERASWFIDNDDKGIEDYFKEKGIKDFKANSLNKSDEPEEESSTSKNDGMNIGRFSVKVNN